MADKTPDLSLQATSVTDVIRNMLIPNYGLEGVPSVPKSAGAIGVAASTFYQKIDPKRRGAIAADDLPLLTLAAKRSGNPWYGLAIEAACLQAGFVALELPEEDEAPEPEHVMHALAKEISEHSDVVQAVTAMFHPDSPGGVDPTSEELRGLVKEVIEDVTTKMRLVRAVSAVVAEREGRVPDVQFAATLADAERMSR